MEIPLHHRDRETVVLAMALCRQIEPRHGSPVQNLIRLLADKEGWGVPLELDELNVYWVLTNVVTPKMMSLRILRGDGLGFEGDQVGESREIGYPRSGFPAIQECTAKFERLIFPACGKYRVVLELDGEPVSQRIFMVENTLR